MIEKEETVKNIGLETPSSNIMPKDSTELKKSKSIQKDLGALSNHGS